jgi:hypothetical protein
MGRPLAMALLLAAAAAAPTELRAQGLGESFGRWQQQPRSCQVVFPLGGKASCRSMQLDQRSPLVMRLSLLAPGALKGGLQQLTLAGQLQEGSPPMRCRQGVCEPQGPLQLQLASISETQFDGRGLAQGVPRITAVQGQCRIDSTAIRCEASTELFRRWTVVLSL